MTLADVHDMYEAFTKQFNDGDISAADYSAALLNLKEQADDSNIPFIFNFEALDLLVQQVAANDDNEPWLATIEDLDEEPSSEDEIYSEESSSEEDGWWGVDEEDSEDEDLVVDFDGE